MKFLKTLSAAIIAASLSLTPANATWFGHGQAKGTVAPLLPAVVLVANNPATADLGPGAAVDIQVQFNEPVTVASGTPTIATNAGSLLGSYSSGSGTSLLHFTTTVGALGSGQNTAALKPAASAAISLNGATIKDASLQPANLSPANGYTPAGVLQIDTTAPVANSAIATCGGCVAGSGTVTTGSLVTITVAYSETVNVTGAPSLGLNNAGTASYASGSGTNSLAFNYTVVSGQSTPDLAIASFNLNGGTIKDGANNNSVNTAVVGALPGTLVVNASGSNVPFVCSGTNNNFYIAANGSDSNNGTSQTTPWLTLSKINSGHFTAGQCISLRGGDTFTPANSGACPSFTPSNVTGSSTNPIYFQSYGTGTASMNLTNCSTGNTHSSGIYVDSTRGLTIQNMIMFATGGSGSNFVQDGIYIANNAGGTTDKLTIQGMDISGFATPPDNSFGDAGGYEIYLDNNATGSTTNFSILNNSLHGRGCSLTPGVTCNSPEDGGIAAGASAASGTISGNNIYNTGGGHTRTGALIGLFNGATNITVSHNHLWNGGNNVVSCGGMSGVETASGTPGIVIQYNEIDHMAQAGGCDADGIDLDGDTTNSIVEYNYTHDNAGAGIYGWMGTYGGNCSPCVWGGNIYRYNISENDGNLGSRGGGGNFGSMTFNYTGGTMSGSPTVQIYNNTVFQNGQGGSLPRYAISFFVNNNFTGTFENNNIITTSGNYGIYCQGGSLTGLTLKNNNYYFPSGGFQLGQSCPFGNQTTLAGWKSASGETTATSTNPQLAGSPPFSTCTTWNTGAQNTSTPSGPQPCPTGYQLQTGSPMLGAGFSVPGSGGGFDYYNNIVPPTGQSVGAFQGTGGGSSGYIGPLDAIGGTVHVAACYSMRACSVAWANAGSNVYQVKRDSDGTTLNVAALSNGAANNAAAATFCSGTVCHVNTWYDQSGQGNDQHPTPIGTDTPLWTPNCIGSPQTTPCMEMSLTGSLKMLSNESFSTADPQPYSGSYIAQFVQNFVNDQFVWGTSCCAAFRNGAGHKNGGGVMVDDQDAYCTAPMPDDGAWHAVQNILNGGTSAVRYDANKTTCAITNNVGLVVGPNTQHSLQIGAAKDYGYTLDGRLAEVILFNATTFTDQQMSNLCNNQRPWANTPACQ